MDEDRVRRPLADDPDFLDSLEALERGLETYQGRQRSDDRTHPPLAGPRPEPGIPAATPAARPPARPAIAPGPQRGGESRRIPLPPSIASPFDALTFDAPPAESLAAPAPPAAAPPPTVASPPAAKPAPALGRREPAPVERKPILDLFPPLQPDSPSESLPLQTPVPLEPSRHVEEPAAHESYEAFYGLNEAPFSLSTDPRFFFHATPHDVVGQRLLTAIRSREGLVLLTGDVGTGKTLLCRTLMEQLDRRTLTSLVGNPFISGEDLLKTILADFGVMSPGELSHGPLATRHELSTTLQSFIESLAPLEASAVVIIDEAQNLPPDVLEQVRILSESAEATSLLQVVLVGQSSLTTMLRKADYKALQQRVTVRTTLGPLPPSEVGPYVAHRLAVAGNPPRVQFNDGAIARIAALSRGVPRVINLLADRALARGMDVSSSMIDVALVDAAAEDLDIGDPRSRFQELSAKAAGVAALAACALAGAGLAAWLFRDAFLRLIHR